ncbi:MAG: hypothetical protein M0C28_37635 [Candidatus Moduliflexus flocculans]|nr:hypothetical protein [Candidatus Moduliflexus flocculans]
MERLASFIVPAVFLAALVGCPAPFSFVEAPGETALPSDGVNDSARTAARTFTFETLFPVDIELEVDLYDVDEDGRILRIPCRRAPRRSGQP